ncbi:MAG TPA: glycine cleavage system protein GcvH [Burkholderiales bacterium]|jgi:glycine cleavage system H protein|nr:glycine cleavage system protein GcvH [Burkholderiales bacterium]
MSNPEDLKYTEAHTWLRAVSGGAYDVGITDHAQDALGDIVFVQPPAQGRKVAQGESIAVVESVKAASDIYAPVSGEIIAINVELDDAPEKINQDPYATWLFRIRPDNASDVAALLDAAAYQRVADADQA